MSKNQTFEDFEVAINMGKLTTEERAIASSAFLNGLSSEHARSIIESVNNRRDFFKSNDLDHDQDFDDWYALLYLDEASEAEEVNEDSFLAYSLWVHKCEAYKAKEIIEDARTYRIENQPTRPGGGM